MTARGVRDACQISFVMSGPTRTGSFVAPSAALVAEKEHFGAGRRARWFGT